MSTYSNLLAQIPTEIPIDFENFTEAGQNLQGSTVLTNFNLGFTNWLGNILSIIMVIALLILLGMLIYGALGWLTSQGDSSKLEAARNRMMHAIIGILILSSVLAMFVFVQYLLGLNVLTVGSGAPNAPFS